MNICLMTRKQFEEVPFARGMGEIEGRTLIILPSRKIHDSGYRCMSFILTQDDDKLVQLGGCSDVIHVDGIGGYGHESQKQPYDFSRRLVVPSGWSIDCLKTSGLLQMWPSSRKIIAETGGYSSFEMWAGDKK